MSQLLQLAGQNCVYQPINIKKSSQPSVSFYVTQVLQMSGDHLVIIGSWQPK